MYWNVQFYIMSKGTKSMPVKWLSNHNRATKFSFHLSQICMFIYFFPFLWTYIFSLFHIPFFFFYMLVSMQAGWSCLQCVCVYRRSIYLCLPAVSLWVSLIALSVDAYGGSHTCPRAAEPKHDAGRVCEHDPQSLEVRDEVSQPSTAMIFEIWTLDGASCSAAWKAEVLKILHKNTFFNSSIFFYTHRCTEDMCTYMCECVHSPHPLSISRMFSHL